MVERIRVLLVDDQDLVRYGLRLVLEAEDDIVVVGEASDGEQAVISTGRLKADVVLVDVRMPGMNGIEATRQITSRWPGTQVIVLTTYDLDEFAFGALQAGAAGFLLKNTRPEELVSAIRTVVSGDSVISPRITSKLIEVAMPHLSPAGDTGADESLAELSDREHEVFLLVGRGLTNGEIAEELHLSESTVKAHFGRILTKLGADNRVQAVIRAYELGLVGPGRADTR